MGVEIAFYLLSALTVFSCLMVVLSAGAVKSVLFLIFAYLNTAAIFILAGQDFAAMLLTVVYVGAVAVLFLFVVMMLDSEGGRVKNAVFSHAPSVAILSAIFVLEIIAALGVREASADPEKLFYDGVSIADVGKVLYTDHIFYFQASGVILLLAMVGAIALTLRNRPGVRRQNIAEQVFRDPADAMKLVQIKPGAGLED